VWTYETAVLLGTDIKDALPYNDYFEYYGPDYRLHMPVSNMENLNSKEYLENIKVQLFDILSQVEPAPGVQIQAGASSEAPPPEVPQVEEDEDAEAAARSAIDAAARPRLPVDDVTLGAPSRTSRTVGGSSSYATRAVGGSSLEDCLSGPARWAPPGALRLLADVLCAPGAHCSRACVAHPAEPLGGTTTPGCSDTSPRPRSSPGAASMTLRSRDLLRTGSR